MTNPRATPKLDEQLEWILGVLDRHSIPHWVERGTLLGLAREGRLFEDDKDIDIGTWSKYEPRLCHALDEIRHAGYKITFQTYARRMSICSFLPKSGGLRGIDIYLFQEHGNYAWLPELLAQDPYEKGTLRHYLYFLNPCRFFNKLFCFLRLDRFFDASAWPLRDVVDVAIWRVPRVYLDSFVCMVDPRVLAPRDWEGYLRFVYGAWRTPKVWRLGSPPYGGFVHMPPWKWIPSVATCSEASANSESGY